MSMAASLLGIVLASPAPTLADPTPRLPPPALITPAPGDQLLALDIQWRRVAGAASYRIEISEQGRPLIEETLVPEHAHAPRRVRLGSAQTQRLAGRGVSVSVSGCVDARAQRCAPSNASVDVYVRGPAVEVVNPPVSSSGTNPAQPLLRMQWRPYTGFAESASIGTLRYEVTVRAPGQRERRYETTDTWLELPASTDDASRARLAWQVVACNAVNCSVPGRTWFID